MDPARPRAGLDAGNDAGRDSGHHVGRAAGHDAGLGAGQDAGHGAGQDAGHQRGGPFRWRPHKRRPDRWGPFAGHGRYGPGWGPPDPVTQGRGGILRDVLLPIVVGVFAVFGTHQAAIDQVPPRQALDGVAYALVLIAAAGLAFRRWPVVSLAITAASTAAYLASDYPYGPIFFPLAYSVFIVAASLPVRRSMVAGGIALVVVLGAELSNTAAEDLLTDGFRAAPFSGWLLLPWAVGTMVQFRREAVVRQREEARRRHGYEERLAIARDVHDVVGHGLAVINMQAGIALHVLEKRPEQAAVALDAIKRTSKDALDDLRATLAVYRRDDESADRRPTPGLGQLDGLIAATSEGGLAVELRTEGEPVELPASVDLTAYRIVQESLTNVLRHADPAAATVLVRYEPGAVNLSITDNGRARPGDPVGASGHGITGMRERAAAVGGELTAGPRPGGGFAVRARLPLGE